MSEVTEEEFLAYEDVRESGVTNMFAIDTVMALSGLDRVTILTIIRHYSELADKYL